MAIIDICFFLPMLACVIAYSNKAFCPRSLSNACTRPTPVPSGACSITFILWGEKNWNRGALSFSSVTWTVTWNYFTKLLQFTNPLTQIKLTNASQFLPQFCCIFVMTRARSVGYSKFSRHHITWVAACKQRITCVTVQGPRNPGIVFKNSLKG